MHAKKEIKKKRMQHINISIKNILYQINESDVVTCVLCGGWSNAEEKKKGSEGRVCSGRVSRVVLGTLM